MSLILVESWNGYGGDATQLARKWPSGTAGLSNTHAKTGTYSMGNAAGNARSRAITAGSQTIYFGMWVYWTGAVPSVAALMLCSLSTAPFWDGFSRHASISFTASHEVAVQGESGATVATSAACLNSGAWNYIAGKFLINNGAGTYEIYCNDIVTPVLSGSGLDTMATFYSSSLQSVYVGTTSNYWVGPVWMFDDTGSDHHAFPTSKLIATAFLPSTGNGANTGFTPSTGTDHGALVDEAVANDDTDYNSGTTGQKDTYIVNTSALAGYAVEGVQVSSTIKPTSAGTNQWAGVTRIGGSDYDGTTKTIAGTSYVVTEQIWALRPSDSAAWTQSDAGEFGGKAVAAVAAIRLTQLYAELLTPESAPAAPTVLIRRTLTSHGTRIGTRQPHWA